MYLIVSSFSLLFRNKKSFFPLLLFQIYHLSRIGGSTPKEATKRILKTILTDEVAEKFSFYGLKNKKPFAKLTLKDTVFSK